MCCEDFLRGSLWFGSGGDKRLDPISEHFCPRCGIKAGKRCRRHCLSDPQAHRFSPFEEQFAGQEKGGEFIGKQRYQVECEGIATFDEHGHDIGTVSLGKPYGASVPFAVSDAAE